MPLVLQNEWQLNISDTLHQIMFKIIILSQIGSDRYQKLIFKYFFPPPGELCCESFFKTLTVRTVGAVCMIKHQVMPRRGWWINLGMGLVPIKKVSLMYIYLPN